MGGEQLQSIPFVTFEPNVFQRGARGTTRAACLALAAPTFLSSERAQDVTAQTSLAGLVTTSDPDASIPPNPAPTGRATANVAEVSNSDDSRVEAQLRPFIFTLDRDHLFGDWGGLLPQAQDSDLTPTLNYLTDIAYHPIGGKNPGVA